MLATKVHEVFTITEKGEGFLNVLSVIVKTLRRFIAAALVEMPLTLSPVMVSLFLVTSIVALPRTWLVIGERT